MQTKKCILRPVARTDRSKCIFSPQTSVIVAQMHHAIREPVFAIKDSPQINMENVWVSQTNVNYIAYSDHFTCSKKLEDTLNVSH